jgi:hypothetical protein
MRKSKRELLRGCIVEIKIMLSNSLPGSDLWHNNRHNENMQLFQVNILLKYWLKLIKKLLHNWFYEQYLQ